MKFDEFVESVFSGIAKGSTIEDIAEKHGVSAEHIASQLKKGIKIEHEHTKDNNTARKIAMDHLSEDPDYYTKLADIVEK